MKCSEVERKYQVLQDFEKTQNELETARKFNLDQIRVMQILTQKVQIEDLHGKIHCKFCGQRVIKSQFSMSSLRYYQSKHRASCEIFLKCFHSNSRKGGICKVCGLKLKKKIGETYDMHFAKYHSKLESSEMIEPTVEEPINQVQNRDEDQVQKEDETLVQNQDDNQVQNQDETQVQNQIDNTENESNNIDEGSENEMDNEIPDLEEGSTPKRRKRKRSSRGSPVVQDAKADIIDHLQAPKRRRLSVLLNRLNMDSLSRPDPNAETITINDDSEEEQEITILENLDKKEIKIEDEVFIIEEDEPIENLKAKIAKNLGISHNEFKTEIKDEVIIIEEPEIQISSVQSVNDQEPGQASVIYHCLFCTKVFWSEEFTLKHLLDFHAISREYLSKFGLKIKSTHL